MTFRDCRVRGIGIGPVIVEDTLIDGLWTAQPVFVWGPALKHVTIRGRVGSVMISDVHKPAASPVEERAFLDANRAYYRSVDWALDITEAEFEEADIRGVPGDLVRRDPRDQVLVRRDDLLDGRWRSIDLDGTYWPTSLQLMLNHNWESQVLLAPRGDKAYRMLVRGLMRLRDAGIADVNRVT